MEFGLTAMETKKSNFKHIAILLLLSVVSVFTTNIYLKQNASGTTFASETETANISFIPSQGFLPPDLPITVAIDAKNNRLVFARIVIRFDQTKVQMATEATINPAFGTIVARSTSAEANTTGKLVVVAGITPPSVPVSGIINDFIAFNLSAISTTANDAVQLSFDVDDMQLVNSMPVADIRMLAGLVTYILNPVATLTPTETPVPTVTEIPTPTFTPTPSPLPTDIPTPTVTLPPPTAIPTTSVDTTPPTVNITNPINGAIVTKSTVVTIQADANDNVAVTKVEFYVNGKRRCTDMIVPFTCVWSVPSNPNTSYSIQARAYDALNNISTQQITVTSSN